MPDQYSAVKTKGGEGEGLERRIVVRKKGKEGKASRECFRAERDMAQISAGTISLVTSIFWRFPQIARKCWNITSIRTPSLPSRSFTVYCSSIILPSDTVYFKYRKP
jgi:hypothetical protein